MPSVIGFYIQEVKCQAQSRDPFGQLVIFLISPPKDVRLEVCLPSENLEYELRPDGCHLKGGSFQPGNYLDVKWQGARRFWAVLRPANEKETLPIANDLPNNMGLLFDNNDLVLIKKIDDEKNDFDGIESDAATLIARDRGMAFYLAIAATKADLGNGIGFTASDVLMITVKGLQGAVFVDRPHKQPEPMKPVSLTVRDPRLRFGNAIICDDKQLGVCFEGGFTITFETIGMHSWTIKS